MQADAKKRLAS